MPNRLDLSFAEQQYYVELSTVCRLASQRGFAAVAQHWEASRLLRLSRRMIVVKPKRKLEDFRCLYYGDELQRIFKNDLSGCQFKEIEFFDDKRYAFEAYQLVATHALPHLMRILSKKTLNGAPFYYTRIICPILSRDKVSLVAAMVIFDEMTESGCFDLD